MYQMEAPNTKFWNNVSTSHTEGSTTTKSSLLNGVLGSTYENVQIITTLDIIFTFIDMSETGSYRLVQDYLQSKSWLQPSDRGTFGNDTGTNPFHGSYNQEYHLQYKHKEHLELIVLPLRAMLVVVQV